MLKKKINEDSLCVKEGRKAKSSNQNMFLLVDQDGNHQKSYKRLVFGLAYTIFTQRKKISIKL